MRRGRIQKIPKANGQKAGYMVITGSLRTTKVFRSRKSAHKYKKGLKI